MNATSLSLGGSAVATLTGGAIGSMTAGSATLSAKAPVTITPAALAWNGATTFAGGSSVAINPAAGATIVAAGGSSISLIENTSLLAGGASIRSRPGAVVLPINIGAASRC